MTALSPIPVPGVVAGTPRTILRLEGALMLAATSYAYGRMGNGWSFYALMFFVPDLSMLGYLAGRGVGAALYNLGHGYALPAMLAGIGVALSWHLALAFGLVWLAHIGFDRLMGYGLKYPTGFAHTHLGMGATPPVARPYSPSLGPHQPGR